MSGDIQVQVFIDGKPAERIGPFITLETDVRDNEYLGEVSARYDSIYKGTMTLEFKLENKDGLNRFLYGAWSVRTRSGAWLVKGKGPTRRYSTKALAEREVQRRRRARKGRVS